MLNRLVRVFYVTFALSILLGSYSAEIVERHPDARLQRNMVEFVALLNDGERSSLERYVRERYDASMLGGMSVTDSAAFLAGVNEHRSPVELCCFQLAENIPDGMAVAYLRSERLDSWSSLQVRFDGKDKLTSLMIVPAKPPEGFAQLEKLDTAEFAEEFDRFLQQLAAKEAFSGSVLVARDGEPLFQRAYGLANREHSVPNTTDTKFRLGSMNKMLTAVAVAQLMEAGKLSFDDPIGKHLPPGWALEEVGKSVRVRHLLNHTSGLGDYLTPMLEGAIYKYSAMSDYKHLVAKQRPSFEPGSEWSYSNTGFLLLGAIVENLSGMDYYEYIRQRIYTPAGMLHSDHYDHTLPPAKLAEGYYHDGEQLRKNMLFLAPRGTSAGGGYSTVGDMLAFDQALRHNKLIRAETRDELFKPRPEANSPSYGYGFMIHSIGSDREVGHGGTFPGTTAQLAIFLDSGYTFVALCNGLGAQAAYNKALSLIERLKVD